MANKYWIANNPNAEITNAEVTELGSISEIDFGVLSDLTVDKDELNQLDASATHAIPADTAVTISKWAKATYDFAEHGGAISAIGLGVTLPDNSIILDGFVEIVTTCQTANTDAGTGALHIEGANDLRTATAVSSGTFWDGPLIKAIVPVGTVASYIKLTAAREITFTIVGEVFLAGKFNVWLNYVVGG